MYKRVSDLNIFNLFITVFLELKNELLQFLGLAMRYST